MASEHWHQVGAPAEGATRSERAASLREAIERHDDFTLIGERSAYLDGRPAHVFVVLCTCEGVPTKNRVGIHYREPLAIIVSTNLKVVPRVRALRRDFPVTGHQNAVGDGEPAELCLYEQPPISVLRTWTAPAFLRRIQEWLIDTAQGRLHQADQPLEQLFFDSPHEIILPAGYLDKPEAVGTPLVITDIAQRFESADAKREHPAYSVFLEPNRGQAATDTVTQIVTLPLAPVVHGAIEREPSSLGGLEDLLRARGATFIGALSDHVRQYVGAGRDPEPQYKATILLLLAPLQRTAGGEIERVQARAYWLDVNLLDLGVAAGVLVRDLRVDNRYYVDHLRAPAGAAADTWRAVKLDAFSVHMIADRDAARRISGTPDAGPRGVLAGAGALGSALLDLWRRAGWGDWTVIDPDRLKPHNIIRHTSRFLGLPKAQAVVADDRILWRTGKTEIEAIVADVGDLQDPAVAAALTAGTLIVDATTTVEVPRHLGNEHLAGRIVSAFITPSGSDSVLIAEDGERRRRIDMLEAQYWRAVLNEDWGSEHVALPGKTFRSGMSCRDVSLVMPYSGILAHATTLAEQIQSLPADALIRVWQRDRSRGTVSCHDIVVAEPQVSTLAHLNVVWDTGMLHKIRRLRTAALPAETGGVLVGYHDLNERRIYVVDALDAPADSIGTPESFERGIRGLASRVGEIARRSAGQITYLGEWHSHPEGHRADESVHDLWQLLYLGELLQRDGLPALMFIVAEDDYQWLLAM